MPAFPYQTKAVRDLAWACFSPPLLHVEQLVDDGDPVAACHLQLTPQRQCWLERLDANPQPLLAHLSRPGGQRLGIYFERLWHFFLDEDEGLELVAHNLPVRDCGQTVGEFDCLYWCHEQQRHFHLELAVKFFLGYRQATSGEPASHWHEWLGPNSNDRLDLKIEQLLQRQSRLGEHPRARAQLAALGIDQPAREIAISGYLFRPLADALPPPYGFNAAHQLHRWLPLDALAAYLEALPARGFRLLPRLEWLGPASARGQAGVLSRGELLKGLQSLFADQDKAQLVVGLDPGGAETHRFFVTHQHWPQNPR